jgi:hypothetical protein
VPSEGHWQLEVTETWRRKARLTLSRPGRDLGPNGWPLLLDAQPDRIAASSGRDRDCYRRVRWLAPVRTGSITFASRTRAVRRGRRIVGRVEDVSATLGTDVVAESRTVWGSSPGSQLEGRVGTPDWSELELSPATCRKVVISAGEVDDFTHLVSEHSSVSAQPDVSGGRLWKAVPGALLLTRALMERTPTSAGSIEMWFPRPIPIGALLQMERIGEEPALTRYLVVGDGQTGALARASCDIGRTLRRVTSIDGSICRAGAQISA